MDLFDDYFRTLRIFLPKDQRDDIIRELSEEIRSQVADKEADLGRPLNAGEQAAIIGQYGHPLLTAARYRPQRYLIGPVVFPYYWLVLKVAIGLVVAGHVIGGIVLLAGGASFAEMGEVLEDLVGTLLKVLGWITVLAAFADMWLARSRVLEKWNPSTPFPPLQYAERAVQHAAGAVQHAVAAVPGAHRHSPLSWPRLSKRLSGPPSVSGFIVGVVVSAWWLLGLKFPYLFFGPGAADVSWGTAMDRLYPVLVVAQLTILAEHFVRLTRPHDTRFFRISGVVWLVAGWAFIYLVATSDHQWVVWRGAAEASARATIITKIAGRELSLIDLVNYALSIPFIIAAIGGVVGSVRALLRWFSRRGPTAAHA